MMRMPPQRTRPPDRIALIGGFGSGNFGNDASLSAALDMLRTQWPGTEFHCVCTDPAKVTERFGIPAIRLAHRPSGLPALMDNALLRLPSGLFNWGRAVWLASRYDWFLFPGTGVLDDYRTGPLGFPAQIFRWCVAARLRGAKVAFWCVGAGPIVNPLSRFFLKSAALSASYRSYRDAGSKDFMQELGIDESQSNVAGDLVFAALTPDVPQEHDQDPPTVGLGVMSYRGWRINEQLGASYLDMLAEFVRHAEHKGWRVLLLPAEPSDRRACDRLTDLLGDGLDRRCSAETLDDVMTHIAACDVVVGSRYHVLIAGLKMARPCISLSYGPKHEFLLSELGLGQFCLPADDLSFADLVRHFDVIAANVEGYSKLVRNRLPEVKQRILESNQTLYAAMEARTAATSFTAIGVYD